jgi:hypothetical protein
MIRNKNGRVAAALLLASLATACAPAARPLAFRPEPIDQTRPADLRVRMPQPDIRLESGARAVHTPVVYSLNPIILGVGLLTSAAIAGTQAAINSNRETTATQRIAPLQGRGLADDFAAAFSRELHAAAEGSWMRGGRAEVVRAGGPEPTLELATTPAATVNLDLTLSRDARSLIARAELTYRRAGDESPAYHQDFVHFSAPVAAATEEQAVALWAAEDARVLRVRAREAAWDLAAMIRRGFLQGEPLDTEALPLRRFVSAGHYGSMRSPDGKSATLGQVVPQEGEGHLLQDDGQRMLVRVKVPGSWALVSLPAAPEPDAR